jgi:aryl-alcohol dehydrogenase-like predicted oxidoreductase
MTRRAWLAGVAGAAGAALAHAGPVREYERGGMVYRRLGKTDIDLSLLSFGSHTDPADRIKVGPLGTVLTEAGQTRRDRIIARAFDYGVNLLDVYINEGQLEPAARLVRDRRSRVLVSMAHDFTPDGIDRACRAFGHIDLHRFHTPEIDGRALADWDILRKAKAAGKVRAIGLATHVEKCMETALDELEGIDFIFFPYNFIHARADYSSFLPKAIERGVGLIAMKPLASGSLVQLDPYAHAGAAPERARIELWKRGAKPLMPSVVAELTKTLGRTPDDTLCMAAMRFVYSRQFIHSAITGMFDERWLDDNYKALETYKEVRGEQEQALRGTAEKLRKLGSSWLPAEYRWLDQEWRA